MIVRCNAMLSGCSTFGRGWWPHILSVALFARTESAEVPTSLFKAQGTIRSTANTTGVVVILPVVLPEADGTNFESPTLVER